MKITIEKSERNAEAMAMDVSRLILCEGECEMYEIFCRADFKEIIEQIDKKKLFSLVYFWYSCEFGELELMFPSKERLYGYKCFQDGNKVLFDVENVDISGMTWDQEKDELIEITDENALVIKNELIGRLGYAHVLVDIK